MKVLFLTVAYPEGKDERNIYTDLVQEFKERNNNVYVVCSRERRYCLPTEIKYENGINVLRVKTGNVTKTNIIEKGIATLLLENQFIRAIKQHLKHEDFDLLLYATPPITFERVVKFVKKRSNCKTYLLLKDIFPQNAIDLGMMKKGSLIWRYFRTKEKSLYAISDYIGCMSKANVEYLLKNNPEIEKNKVEVCPNSIKPAPLRDLNNRHLRIRKKYGVPDSAVVFVYGGNLGQPQGLSFLLQVLANVQERENIFFLIIGSGTEYARIENFINTDAKLNVKLLKQLPKADYEDLLKCCDVGLIFLDPRFTIPNFPSRVTDYLQAAIPVLAATDTNTDIKDMLHEAGCGMWAESGDLTKFLNLVDVLANDINLRKQMGLNGRQYLENYYTVSHSYEIITRHVNA
ncbi:MAG: glycosyltransferase family 4 protein [Dethiobacter sp.]|nr:glycosyltransferase family 4 protein [Dethiobacter sp.]MBS4007455.1 glycosyltransferase family 4 protein [Clostridium sp.]